VSAPRLSRATGDAGPAAPVRIVHLGLGNFFRAHQAFYTGTASDAGRWGIAAFTGRSRALADELTAQDGLYTLIVRGPDHDECLLLSSVAAARPGTDLDAWRDYLSRPAVRIVTLTVTEAGYLRDHGGALDVADADVRADVAALRADRADVAALHADRSAAAWTAPGSVVSVRTVPGRLVAGLAARRAAGAGPIAVVSCDNLPDNGAVTAGVVADFANLLDPALAAWISDNVSFVTTMVDRITPRTTPDDVRAVTELTGRTDAAPVVTEPYHEWVLSGEFPGGRPAWQDGGARFVADITPYEQRKLWLLNGGHSLLAYAGAVRGHDTIAEAVTDPVCRAWLHQWWTEASGQLPMPATDVAEYRAALLRRFANPRIQHRLVQIAADGSQKLPIRVLPVLRAERARGRVPMGALRILAAWIVHLRGEGVPVTDAAAATVVEAATGPIDEAVRHALAYLDPALAADGDIATAVTDLIAQLTPS
jgi:fructuronate reductase